jgi:hypothetical protein
MLATLTAIPLTAQDDDRAVAPLEVRPTPAFASAVEAGTRTETGVPGENYWQQRVDYDIDVTVDPATRLLTGSETITYTTDRPIRSTTSSFTCIKTFSPKVRSVRAACR